MSRRASATCALSATTAVAIMAAPAARADDKRLNDGVVANVYTVQRQAGCTNDVTINPQLQLAAQWHTLDLLNNRHLNDDTGSDGSTPQDRAHAAAPIVNAPAALSSVSPYIRAMSVNAVPARISSS